MESRKGWTIIQRPLATKIISFLSYSLTTKLLHHNLLHVLKKKKKKNYYNINPKLFKNGTKSKNLVQPYPLTYNPYTISIILYNITNIISI